ncbi:MAG TPA: XTP/dITP diphosphatase [candidate division Zixibacteria bacterium]|nr:XTP/dITP diphosphatase [candidate division Zixibacteria bacterium]
MKGHFVFFATNNVDKFNEARQVLAESKIAVAMLRVKSLEIQSDSLEEIAQASVMESFKKYRLPMVVEDAGLFVDALNGFPGPYAAYAYRTIGNKGLLRLMERVGNRKATFRSVIAYFSLQPKSPICFEGSVSGQIVHEERKIDNKMGFGFDPIFMPDKCDKTFAQMNVVEKCKRSHRADAFRKFAAWYQ